MNFRTSPSASPGCRIITNTSLKYFKTPKIGVLSHFDYNTTPPMWKVEWDDKWVGWLNRKDFDILED